jgi:hypothetical protein
MDLSMRLAPKFAISLALVVVALGLAEIALHLYVTMIGRQGRLFSLDQTTGWRPLPMLKLTRLNASGQEWTIETDQMGQRILDAPTNPKRTILILGDSFAFGEGVNIEDRFDQKIRAAIPDARIINTGVMGFGTDQQYLAARPYFSQLTNGDLVLVLFNRTDFFDVQRRRFVQRSKPRFELTPSGYEPRTPEISMLDIARERSYVARLLARAIESSDGSIETIRLDDPKATEIIRSILARIRREIPQGVPIVFAYNGDRSDDVLAKEYSGAQFCDLVDLCIDLDAVARSPASFLPDGHWSAHGNAVAGDAIAKALRAFPTN